MGIGKMNLKIIISCLILALGLSQAAHARLHVEISGGGCQWYTHCDYAIWC